ncbi:MULTISPECIES: virulence RhuM family protein [unclassified Facklamia]|uniref:virulence RhuM family protein n=1 Tax=Aerococcaceae TaxID=186827 RepID=UPI0013BC4383|nr:MULTISPECIES: virulence RhuM family protein [unclassified Facklamia]NEW65309.1 cell filamentation protein Fic [Facklamia sp. 252]NEW68791.1 cell filamentation protein Fic [Facklamia sp. 253]QQD66102.1 virulence RhuM family protein [Aerococcaceae bacterium zg-252]
MEIEMQQFVLYENDNRDIIADVMVWHDTLWMPQKQMAELFNVDISTINEHIKNIYKTGELEESSTIGKFPIVQIEGARQVTRQVYFYNLDMIISVGYRVNSQKATHFRQWATSVLKEYMIKGFAMDDERLKQGSNLLGKDYFQELLERVRSIRASERRIWQQITDIFAEVSTDYDKNSEVTRLFYAHVQDKFHYAITGQTAAEIIYKQADNTKENMGLTTWKSAPNGRILKSDAQIAKNYLSEKEIKSLERTVTQYFDYIEGLIERRNTFTMEEFANSVERFLDFNEYKILEGHGKISSKQAKEKAKTEYDIFNKRQTIISDFDKEIKRITDKNK